MRWDYPFYKSTNLQDGKIAYSCMDINQQEQVARNQLGRLNDNHRAFIIMENILKCQIKL